MKLQRYWFKFALTISDPHPPGVLLGCGVTAFSQEDAIEIIKERVFTEIPLPAIQSIQENVDIATLDPGRIRPNMGNVLKRGVWFPIGYDWPRVFQRDGGHWGVGAGVDGEGGAVEGAGGVAKRFA